MKVTAYYSRRTPATAVDLMRLVMLCISAGVLTDEWWEHYGLLPVPAPLVELYKSADGHLASQEKDKCLRKFHAVAKGVYAQVQDEFLKQQDTYLRVEADMLGNPTNDVAAAAETLQALLMYAPVPVDDEAAPSEGGVPLEVAGSGGWAVTEEDEWDDDVVNGDRAAGGVAMSSGGASLQVGGESSGGGAALDSGSEFEDEEAVGKRRLGPARPLTWEYVHEDDDEDGNDVAGILVVGEYSPWRKHGQEVTASAAVLGFDDPIAAVLFSPDLCERFVHATFAQASPAMNLNLVQGSRDDLLQWRKFLNNRPSFRDYLRQWREFTTFFMITRASYALMRYLVRTDWLVWRHLARHAALQAVFRSAPDMVVSGVAWMDMTELRDLQDRAAKMERELLKAMGMATPQPLLAEGDTAERDAAAVSTHTTAVRSVCDQLATLKSLFKSERGVSPRSSTAQVESSSNALPSRHVSCLLNEVDGLYEWAAPSPAGGTVQHVYAYALAAAPPGRLSVVGHVFERLYELPTHQPWGPHQPTGDDLRLVYDDASLVVATSRSLVREVAPATVLQDMLGWTGTKAASVKMVPRLFRCALYCAIICMLSLHAHRVHASGG